MPQHATTNTTRAKAWIGTLNNPTDEQCQQLIGYVSGCKAYTAQLEVGDNGTPHLQFCFVRHDTIRFLALKRELHDAGLGNPHIECARDIKASLKYCNKQDTRAPNQPPGYILAHGVEAYAGQGTRSDLAIIAGIIRDGGSMRDAALEGSTAFIRNYRGLQRFQDLVAPVQPRNDPRRWPQVYILWGNSGTSKSTAARDKAGDKAYHLPYSDNYKWWADYDPRLHDTIIIDDFDPLNMKWHFFKRMINWTPCKVETKGGFVELTARRFILTCNTPPEQWWEHERSAPAEASVFARRVPDRRIYHFDTPAEPPSSDDESELDFNH